MELINKRKTGFSLLELVISIAILGIISVSLSIVFTRGYSVFKIEKSRNLMQEESRTAIDIVDSWIRKTYSVLSSYTALDLTVYTTDAQVLILKIQSIDADSALISGTYDYLIFKINPSNSARLEKITYADAASTRTSGTLTIALHLNSLAFTYYDSTGIQLAADYENSVLIKTLISSQEVAGGTTNTSQLSSETKIRNK